jgi:hypothetical protein
MAPQDARPWARRVIIGALAGGALGSFSFWLWLYPAPTHLLGPGLTGFLARLLDAPASALNVCLPDPLRSGVAAQFLSTTFCFPTQSTAYLLSRYLAVAIPAYVILFSIPAAIRIIVARVRSGLVHGRKAA